MKYSVLPTLSLLTLNLATLSSFATAEGNNSDKVDGSHIARQNIVKADVGLSRLFKSRFPSHLNPKEQISSFDVCPSQSDVKQPNQLYSGSSQQSQTVFADSKIQLFADAVPENHDQRTVLEGNVTMTSSSSILRADKMISDNVNESISARGNVSVENKDSLLLASSFEGDKISEESTLSDVKFHFFSNNANGEAESISFNENSVAVLNELTFSTCPAGNNSWRFSATELELDQKSGRGEAWGMWMKVEGIPIFYFPYLNFPIDDQRKSGMLMPLIGNGGRNGIDIAIPIYWNIAEHTDMTFTPRTIQNRGGQLGVEWRYLTEKSMNQVSLEWLREDRLTQDLLVRQPELADGLYGLNEQRWAVTMDNTTQFDENWTANVKVNRVSDRDYFRDLGSEIISRKGSNSQTILTSHGDITYQDDIWQISMLAESTQALAGSEPYRLLPSLISSANYYHQTSGLQLQFESDFSRFDHSDQLKIEGKRFNMKPSISFPIRNYFSWLTPKLSYQMTSYDQKDITTNNDTNITREVPIFSVDGGLFFDRDTFWDGKPSTQSLEPRLFYAYIPYRNQEAINNFDSRLPDFNFSQLSRANRFVGGDRVGDTNHLAMSLTSRHIDNSSGDQLLAVSVGRKLFFEDAQVSIEGPSQIEKNTFSPWLAEVKYRPNDKLLLSGFIEWSDENSRQSNGPKTRIARSQIKYEPIRDHIVNLSHRVRNYANQPAFEPNEEIDLSFAWPINDQWRLVGRWYNDLERGRTSESLYGFEYESCCWAISVIARRYIDVRLDAFGNPLSNSQTFGLDEEFNSGIQVQFVFKGLGNPGKKGVSRLLEESINGYRSRF